jgi:hypothetical protein
MDMASETNVGGRDRSRSDHASVTDGDARRGYGTGADDRGKAEPVLAALGREALPQARIAHAANDPRVPVLAGEVLKREHDCAIHRRPHSRGVVVDEADEVLRTVVRQAALEIGGNLAPVPPRSIDGYLHGALPAARLLLSGIRQRVCRNRNGHTPLVA